MLVQLVYTFPESHILVLLAIAIYALVLPPQLDSAS